MTVEAMSAQEQMLPTPRRITFFEEVRYMAGAVLHKLDRRYLYSTLLVALVTAICFPIYGLINLENLVMIYLATVVIAAIHLKKGPAILATFLGAGIFDFLFVEPRYTIGLGDVQYALAFAVFLMLGMVIGDLIARDQEYQC
jgi:K+-sensing histidine kinase KdpD